MNSVESTNTMSCCIVQKKYFKEVHEHGPSCYKGTLMPDFIIQGVQKMKKINSDDYVITLFRNNIN